MSWIEPLALKQALLEAIKASDDEGRYDDATVDRIHGLIADLLPHTQLPRPCDAQDKVTGAWGSLFAQFGPKHTAGKPIKHESRFKFLSFNTFPDQPMRVLHIEQEIHHETGDYNNVHVIEPIGGGLQAWLIVYGRYAMHAELPQRYDVDFYRVALLGANGESSEAVRAAYDLDAEQPMAVNLKPPKLHSDVVYCDHDMRINFGSMGGVYVLGRNQHPGYSVQLP